jgi:hypothetical protein
VLELGNREAQMMCCPRPRAISRQGIRVLAPLSHPRDLPGNDAANRLRLPPSNRGSAEIADNTLDGKGAERRRSTSTPT